MKSERNPEEYSPHQARPASNGQQYKSGKNYRNEIQAVEPYLNGSLHQIRCVPPYDTIIVLLSSAFQDPSHVGPPATVARRVRITRLFSKSDECDELQPS